MVASKFLFQFVRSQMPANAKLKSIQVDYGFSKDQIVYEDGSLYDVDRRDEAFDNMLESLKDIDNDEGRMPLHHTVELKRIQVDLDISNGQIVYEDVTYDVGSLIEAFCDMLDALKSFVDNNEGWVCGFDTPCSCPKCQARKAIAKAEELLDE